MLLEKHRVCYRLLNFRAGELISNKLVVKNPGNALASAVLRRAAIWNGSLD